MLSPDVDPGEADLAEIGAALRRRLALIAVTTLLALALALAYLAVAKPKFVATTSILIDARARAPVGSDGALPPMSPDLNLIDSQIKIITSESVLRRVVVAERLDLDPDYAPTTPGLRTRLMTMIGLGPKPSPGGEPDRVTKAIGALALDVAVRRSERTYVLDIDVTSRDAAKSARLANAVAKAYLDDLQSARDEAARGIAEQIRARLDELRRVVEEAERKIVEHRAANGLFDSNGKSVNQTDLGEVGQQITQARARAAETKVRWEQTRKMARDGLTPDGLMEAAKSALLDKLRAQLVELQRQDSNYSRTLGPLHPAYVELRQQIADTQKAIRAEAGRLVEVAHADHLAARAQEQAALGRLGGSKERTENDEKALVKLRELERDAAASRAAYERFLKASATVAEDAPAGPSARVISPAVAPLGPSSPKTVPTLIIALTAGLGLGIALALLLDFMAAARRRAMARPDAVAATRRRESAAEAEAGPAAPDADEEDDAPAPGRTRGREAAARPASPAGAPVWLDLAAFEADPFAESFGEEEAARMRAEVKVWRLLDDAGAGLPEGLRTVALFDASARSREGLSTRVALALARAAAARGERVLALAGRGSLALDALLACEASRAVEVDGTARVAAPVEDAGGRVHVAAPPDVAPSREERRRSLGEARRAFDLLIHDGPGAGASRAEMCARADAVFVLLGPRDEQSRADQARAAIEAAGGVFGGVLRVGAQPRRPGARSAA